MSSPQVSISVPGVFHAFDLADGLRNHGLLGRIYTPRPAWTIPSEYGPVVEGSVVALPSVEVLGRLAEAAVGTWVGKWLSPQPKMHLFDRRVASHLSDEAEVFVGFAGACLRSLREARRKGMATVVDADHVSRPADWSGDQDEDRDVVDQRAILREEYGKFGREIEIREDYVRREIREYERADCVAVPTSYVKRSIRAVTGLPEERVIELPYGVDTERFCPEGPSVDRSEANLVIVFVGAVKIRKGVHYLLRAFDDAELESAELWIVGPHKEESGELLEQAAPQCRVLGKVARDELPAVYRAADVVVLPSVLEGFGVVLLEAMACGTAVIGTTHTAAVDLVEDGQEGYVVQPADVEALSEALARCSRRRDDLPAMGRAARERSLAYTWSRYVERFLERVGFAACGRSR